ncbi:hypothetical protein GCM10012289_68970 [Nonomuraea cavernae]|uniref:Uncharacterized protein n=1 Tax=Nonomuraea cavernae TaxID=2045107 RepID=A0A918DRW1_9ACTN|nr:hypothetical protein GCM10012289_68970 [Nonomuraea cavernae]
MPALAVASWTAARRETGYRSEDITETNLLGPPGPDFRPGGAGGSRPDVPFPAESARIPPPKIPESSHHSTSHPHRTHFFDDVL